MKFAYRKGSLRSEASEMRRQLFFFLLFNGLFDHAVHFDLIIGPGAFVSAHPFDGAVGITVDDVGAFKGP